LPAGMGKRKREACSSQSKVVGFPPASKGPLGSRESCSTTSPADGAANSMASMPFSYSTAVSSAVAYTMLSPFPIAEQFLQKDEFPSGTFTGSQSASPGGRSNAGRPMFRFNGG